MKTVRLLATIAFGLLGVSTISACQPGVAPSQDAVVGTGQASALASVDGSAGAVDPLAPIIVTPGDDSTTAVVGDEIYFDLLESEAMTVKITTPDTALLEITEAVEGGGTISSASATAMAPGKATIVFTYPDGSTKESVVTIS